MEQTNAGVQEGFPSSGLACRDMALLSGKTVCITGSSRGIGRACAIECAKYGATGLILHYLGDEVTEQEVLSLKQDIEENYSPAKAVVIPGDIGDSATASKASLSPLSPHNPRSERADYTFC